MSVQVFATLEKFTATYAPAQVEDLKPSAAAWIGQQITVQYAGDVACGPYAGQPRFDVLTREAPFFWSPACDLADLAPA